MNEIKTARLVVGKITGVHGLKGGLKVHSFAESPDTFQKGRKIWLASDDRGEKEACYEITGATPQKKGMLIRLNGIDSREGAEILVGLEMRIERSELPALEKDTWYWQDLYGMTVIDQRKGHLGTLEHIFFNGATDILVVTDTVEGKPKETLIPMHEQFVASVDTKAKKVVTTLPDGYDF